MQKTLESMSLPIVQVQSEAIVEPMEVETSQSDAHTTSPAPRQEEGIFSTTRTRSKSRAGTEEPPPRIQMMEAHEATVKLVDSDLVELYNAALRSGRNKPHDAEPFQKEDWERYQGGLPWNQQYGRPESRFASACFNLSLAGLVQLYNNPKMKNWVQQTAKLLSHSLRRIVLKPQRRLCRVLLQRRNSYNTLYFPQLSTPH